MFHFFIEGNHLKFLLVFLRIYLNWCFLLNEKRMNSNFEHRYFFPNSSLFLTEILIQRILQRFIIISTPQRRLLGARCCVECLKKVPTGFMSSSFVRSFVHSFIHLAARSLVKTLFALKLPGLQKLVHLSLHLIVSANCAPANR